MKTIIKHGLSLLLVLSLVLGAAVISASAAPEVEEGYIYVREDFIDDYGFTRAVQFALNEATDYGTPEMPYTVVVPKGEYETRGVLRVFSNTTLDLRGVTMIREGEGAGNMLRVGSEDGVDTGVTGYAYENVHIIGGVFDGNYGENTIIKAFHTKNFIMDDVTLLHEKEGHMTEFAGVDGLTIRGCSFIDQQLTPGNYGYEAIQIDVLHPFHITNGRCEDLPCENVLIEDCYFENMPRGIGSHTAVHNRPHDKITIRDNVFRDMTSIAIQGMNWTNVDISRNYINNAPRGITIYSEPGGCTYLSSKLAAKGNTTSHVSDAYQTPAKANIEICENSLFNIGTSGDKYAKYSSQGIAVLGEKLTSKSPVDSSDESGGLPAGDYYIDGVSIHDNTIDIRGNGIRVEDARSVAVVDNEIICSENTVVSDNYYGIVLRSNVSASTVSYNTILNAEMNGIQLDGTNGGSVSKVRFNRIDGTGKYGIGIYDLTIEKIEDNDIMNTVSYGLFMDGSQITGIKWNRIRNCSSGGIWVTSTSTASTIKSNTTYKCSGKNSYDNNSSIKVDNYYSSSSLTDFYIPWDTKNKVGAQMGVGSRFHIVPDVRPTNALASFTYSSSNEDVVAVDGLGMVYAVGEGQATITVKSDNGITKRYVISVEGDGKVKHLESRPEAPVLICGDADGNGVVESIDATQIQRYLAYMETPISRYTLFHGDVTGDDSLDIIDVSLIQCYLAQFSGLAGMDLPHPIGEPIN